MRNARWALAATILGSTMAFIDGTVVNVALPVLQSDLHATINDAQWVVNAYLLVLSSFILVGGSLGDRFGLVRVFGAGVAVFTCASIWCGLAPDVQQLMIARAVQGVGAALLVPGSLAIITAVYPAKERGKAIGTWSALTAIGVIGGPLLGGTLVQTISWRAVFFINVPIAIVVLWIILRHMPTIRGEAHGSLDWLGAFLVIAALGAITWSLIEAPAHRGPQVIIVALAGIVCLVAFVVVESRAKQPLVPLFLFRSRAFSGANALTLLLYAALSGVMFLLPFELIQMRHYSPSEAGAAFLPVVATMSLLSPLSGALADRIGARPLLIAGPIVAGAGFALLVLCESGTSYWSAFAPGLFVFGLGMGITVAPLTTTVMTSIDDERHAGIASGVNNAIARAAGLLATAVFGAVAVVVFSGELDRQLVARGASSRLRQAMAAQTLRLANAAAPGDTDARTRAIVELSIRSAFQKAFAVDMLGGAALAIISAAGATVIGRTSRKR
ncbi:MAG: MFS transporter [Acidobacteria bacterium]|nr:MAG: MFS transporter [Acidobacteriota bacterium]